MFCVDTAVAYVGLGFQFVFFCFLSDVQVYSDILHMYIC
jgi:hypothetical protein